MNCTILLVEDDPSIREFLTDMLQEEGYHVEESPNGRHALSALLSFPKPPCLIITDLMMPLMDGWELCRTKRSISSLAGIPTILISAAPTLSREAALLGVVAAFPKPLDLQGLLSRVLDICPLL